jgi:hypothetical protein
MPLPRVQELLGRATDAGVEAALVRVENFDEIMRDLVRLKSAIDTSVLDRFAVERRRWSAAPAPGGSKGWPVVRLNALPVIHSPSVCRRVVCNIGGHADVRTAVEAAKVDVVVTRTRAGVLSFGSDTAIRSAFDTYTITDFDLHTIEIRRLRYESGERGLLRDAMTRAIVRHRGLNLIRRGKTDLLAPANPQDGLWADLRSQVGMLTGTVMASPDLKWHEGIGIRLEWAGDRLWLLVEPRTVFQGMTDENRSIAADFARERTVKRYNRQLNDLIGFWAKHLAGDGSDIRALGIGDGVDAAFRLSGDTAFSRRAGA